jgi:hypothetical protein
MEIVGCLLASVASLYKIQKYCHPPRCENQKYLQIVPRVP